LVAEVAAEQPLICTDLKVKNPRRLKPIKSMLGFNPCKTFSRHLLSNSPFSAASEAVPFQNRSGSNAKMLQGPGTARRLSGMGAHPKLPLPGVPGRERIGCVFNGEFLRREAIVQGPHWLAQLFLRLRVRRERRGISARSAQSLRSIKD